MNIFRKSRLLFEEMYKDAQDYLQEKYEQAGQIFSTGSAFGQLLEVIINLGKLIIYYIEDSITELNIKTATRSNSIFGLARLTGHNPTRAISAQGNVKITYNGENVDMYGDSVIIPNYTKIECKENTLPYLIIVPSEEVRIKLTPKNYLIVKIIQGEIESQIATGTGLKLQSFSFFPKRGKNIDHHNIHVFVNSKEWRVYDSLLDIPYQTEGCLIKTGLTDGVDIFFGNGYKGAIPPPGSEIRVEYVVTAGDDGNIRETENVSWKFIDEGYDILGNEVNITEIFDIETETNISFGTNNEPLFLTKILTPNVSRNFVLANPTNYIYFIEKMNYFSYIDAYTSPEEEDDYSEDNAIYLFLVPDINKRIKSNENYFTVPQENFYLSRNEKLNVYSLIEESGSKIISTVAKIIQPVIKRYIVNISLIIFEDFSKDIIRYTIEEKLSNYFLKSRRRDKIPRSDLIAIIENIEGIDSVNVWFTCEENERNKEDDPNADVVGLNNFGDIKMKKDELIIIRGGWKDRNGVFIYDGVDPEKPSSINIDFTKVTPLSYNAIVHNEHLKKLKKDEKE